MRFWHALFVSALLMGPMAMSWSEERENSSELADTSRIDAMKSALEEEDDQSGLQPLQAPVIISGNLMDSEGQAAMKSALKAYYDYRTATDNAYSSGNCCRRGSSLSSSLSW